MHCIYIYIHITVCIYICILYIYIWKKMCIVSNRVFLTCSMFSLIFPFENEKEQNFKSCRKQNCDSAYWWGPGNS